jgi:hypothetical protein
MNLWLDNTGVHAAARCLDGRAAATIDIKGLLQFATLVVFSDQLNVSVFQQADVRRHTEWFGANLLSMGLEPKCLNLREYSASSFFQICRNAAENAASELHSVFEISSNRRQVIGLGPLVHPPRAVVPSESPLALVEQRFDSATYRDIAEEAAARKADGACTYMVATSPSLRQAIRRTVRGNVPGNQHQLTAALNYFVNATMAEREQTTYAPAVRRAELIRADTDGIAHRFDAAIADLLAKVRPLALGALPIAEAIIARSAGCADGVLEEAIRLRNVAAPLRAALSRRLRGISRGSFDFDAALAAEISECTDLLAIELKLQKRPKLLDALDVTFVVGIPSPELSLRDLGTWLNFRWKRKKVAVLTEISRWATEGKRVRNQNWAKLRQHCHRKCAGTCAKFSEGMR